MKKHLHRVISILLVLVFVAGIVISCSREDNNARPEQVVSFRFGVLPAIQALPLFVAAEKGYFMEEGIDVELVSYNSVIEKDKAISMGEIAGYCGDLLSPIVLVANNIPLSVIATNYRTTSPHHMFALVAAPNRPPDEPLQDLSTEGIAVVRDTILDYLKTKMLETHKVDPETAPLIEVNEINMRLELLLSNQIPAAMLSEPLVTLAQKKGARILVEDSGMGMSATVILFGKMFVTEHPNAVRSFCRAVNKAADYINKHNDDARESMNIHCQMPEELKEDFPIPSFPALSSPDRNIIMDVQKWLKNRGIIKEEIPYSDLVSEKRYF